MPSSTDNSKLIADLDSILEKIFYNFKDKDLGLLETRESYLLLDKQTLCLLTPVF